MAILAGGGLAYGTYDYLQNVPVKTVSVPTKKVVVANANLSLGRQLRREDLATLDWPAAAVPEGAFEDPAVDRRPRPDRVGREERTDSSGEARIEGSGQPACRPSSRLASGRCRCASTKSSAWPATCCPARASTSSRPRTRAAARKTSRRKSCCQNVEVLAAGTRLEQDTPDGKPMQVTVVTLLVTPDESERLTLASTEGKIQLALRNPLDTEIAGHVGHQARACCSATCSRGHRSWSRRPAARGQPAPIPPPPPSIEVIRGDKRTQVVVG